MAIATAAKQVIHDGIPIVVAGGLESISLVQNEHVNKFRRNDPTVMKIKPDLYMAMLDTAEVVAKRYRAVPVSKHDHTIAVALAGAIAFTVLDKVHVTFSPNSTAEEVRDELGIAVAHDADLPVFM